MSEITSIIVFGSTGKTGLEILRRGILEDLEVTAFARKPQKIPTEISSKLSRLIQGDVLDSKRVEDAIEGHDAVLSALGTGWGSGESTVVSEGCRNIIAGMKRHDVKKLVVISSSSLLPGGKPFFSFRNKTEDHARQLQLLEEESDSIDWIAMMPSRISSSSHVEPDYKVEKNKTPGVNVVTTGELADFMVKVFMDKTSTKCFRHAKLGISSHLKMTSKRCFKIAVISVVAVATAVVLYYGWLPTILQEFVDEVRQPKGHLPDL